MDKTFADLKCQLNGKKNLSYYFLWMLDFQVLFTFYLQQNEDAKSFKVRLHWRNFVPDFALSLHI